MALISFLLVFLERGASEIASAYSLNEYAADIITGIILFFILGSEFFINYRVIPRGAQRRASDMHSSLRLRGSCAPSCFGTRIMYGALGETVTEKSGNLNLGVPGMMYLGGFAGFASAWAYENSAQPQRLCQHPDRPVLRHSGLDGGRPDLCVPDHLPARQPERHRFGADDLRHGCGKLLRRVYPERRQLLRRSYRQQGVQRQNSRAVGSGRHRAGRVLLRFSRLCGHPAGCGAALVPDPHPCGPESARRR